MNIFKEIKLSIYSYMSFNSKRNVKKYLNFYKNNNYLVDKFNIGDLGDFVLQGLTIIDNKYYISAYDSKYKQNSKIIILDKNKNKIQETMLDTKSHVGGIAYDKNNNIFWITDKSGTISGYDFNDINILNNAEAKFKKIKIGDNIKNVFDIDAIAYMTIYDNKMYVGNYNIKNKSIIKILDIEKSGNLKIENHKTIESDDLIQGIAIKEFNNQKYIFISSSYGIFKSVLKIYKYQDSINNLKELPCIKIKCPKMMEQITFDFNNNLVTLHESNAKKYKKLFSKQYDIRIYNINGIIKEEF